MSRLARLARLARYAFWSAALFALVMALLPRAPQLGPSDKVQHVLAFAVLTALACIAYPRLRLAWIGLGLAAFGAAIELLQTIPALGREGSTRDWLADLAATAAVLAAAAIIRFRSRRSRSRSG